ncbi:MAG: CMP-N-acetylneuraminic acid synthetase [candidate division TM6 bacterium GW2011_GWF2_37_49]|nr:MAG: CMP-N-acetylneuraminic acid synthetase [candidate division TM6 bacterium GW2011_GWF2_37_49]
MVNNKIIAVIAARGGSKRIPKKNIIDFHGEPLLAWTIQAAQQSEIFDKIIVSTDSEEIAQIAKNFGAEIPFMRSNHGDDHSPISFVITDALEQMNKLYQEKFKTVVQLMPSCPLRNAKDIKNAYTNFIETNAKFQISCFSFGWMNPWWAFKLAQDQSSEPIFAEALKKRSQDLEKLYCPTGAIWIADTSELLQHKTFYTPNTKFYPLDWKSAVDIDNYEDLEMAHSIFELMNTTS